MKKGCIVVYESTVYPGVTEDNCRAELEKFSGMKYQDDFHLGYSPERVNPGDKNHTIDKIKKVVAASSPEVLDILDSIYGSVVTAGTHRASNIRTAEAAKVIENTQRDLNIALINEIAQICWKIGIDTEEVLQAAETKWNFLPFRPGLVGGHCIGVDPYYLTHLAMGLGMNPQVISSGRRINDEMPKHTAIEILKKLMAQPKDTSHSELNIAVLGVTFKENVPDYRNTKVVDLVKELRSFGAKVHVVDPHVSSEQFYEEYGEQLVEWDQVPVCQAVVCAVRHAIFTKEYPLERIKEKLASPNLLADLKGTYDLVQARDLGFTTWRL